MQKVSVFDEKEYLISPATIFEIVDSKLNQKNQLYVTIKIVNLTSKKKHLHKSLYFSKIIESNFEKNLRNNESELDLFGNCTNESLGKITGLLYNYSNLDVLEIKINLNILEKDTILRLVQTLSSTNVTKLSLQGTKYE